MKTTLRILILMLMASGTQHLLAQASAPDVLTRAVAFHLSKVTYVMLGVADVSRSLRFYQDKLGLRATAKSEDLAFLDADTISIVVSSEVGKEPGDSEVVFAVDHVQPAYEALRKLGINFEHEPHPLTATAWAANFRDPDGHILSIYGPQ